jgi:hypothetical protein
MSVETPRKVRCLTKTVFQNNFGVESSQPLFALSTTRSPSNSSLPVQGVFDCLLYLGEWYGIFPWCKWHSATSDMKRYMSVYEIQGCIVSHVWKCNYLWKCLYNLYSCYTVFVFPPLSRLSIKWPHILSITELHWLTVHLYPQEVSLPEVYIFIVIIIKQVMSFHYLGSEINSIRILWTKIRCQVNKETRLSGYLNSTAWNNANGKSQK